jgi:F-type H+-transporting ATPase subunit delta
VDPSILGGIVVRYGDRVMDGSLRRRLLSMRNQMLTATHSVS